MSLSCPWAKSQRKGRSVRVKCNMDFHKPHGRYNKHEGLNGTLKRSSWRLIERVTDTDTVENFLEQGRLNQNYDHKERRKMKRTPLIFHSLNPGVTAFWARYELWGGTMIAEGSLKRLRQTSQGKVLLYPLYSPFPFKIRKGPGNGIDSPHTALLFDCSFALITDIPQLFTYHSL